MGRGAPAQATTADSMSMCADGLSAGVDVRSRVLGDKQTAEHKAGVFEQVYIMGEQAYGRSLPNSLYSINHTITASTGVCASSEILRPLFIFLLRSNVVFLCCMTRHPIRRYTRRSSS